jgi:hypothetical protein
MKKLVHKIQVQSENEFDRIYTKRVLELRGLRPFNVNYIIDLTFVSRDRFYKRYKKYP